ncbi:MAG: gamma-glutamyl-gamma-aminobutyrate hydrolase family protein [Bacteroidia bacterium]|nr:gamma-glutamyl-gamma-aminobutyrate hydrolase family protein [Bacteroidia bacterium]
MKRLTFLILLLLTLHTTCAQTKHITRIGLINPDTGSLGNALNLVKKGYLHADSIVIVGLLHKTQKATINATRTYLQNNELTNVKLFVVQGDISLDSLFVENACTREFREIFEKTDAIIRFGGDDIAPKIYGEETFLTTEPVHKGHNWEISFLYHLLGGFQNPAYKPFLEEKPDYLVLGICLGMQELNIATGGSMYQDIPFQIYEKTTYENILKENPANIHKNYWDRVDNENEYSHIQFHPIKITKRSFLDFNRISKEPVVASVHHQAVKKIGKGFSIVATSMDGKVVEALQHTRYKNVYGIQFHTDFSVLYNDDITFKISPTETLTLSDDTHLFHKLFWEDFSGRLK